MLNVCIERVQMRAKKQRGGSDVEGNEDEQFYDCDVSAAASEDADMEDAEEEHHSLWNQPEGRKGRHPTLRILSSGEPLYIPITQPRRSRHHGQCGQCACHQLRKELVPPTESDLEMSEESQAKAYMMSATLSDMESFKAANPSAGIADFVRWYSPRDWELDESGELDRWGQPRGQLSARMQLPDNTWLELWGVAQPVPASRQRRMSAMLSLFSSAIVILPMLFSWWILLIFWLFDETRSAEMVLSWLEGLSASGVALALLPVLAHLSAARLLAEAQRLGDTVPGLQLAVERAVAATRQSAQSVNSYQKLAELLSEAELLVSQFRSLLSKLCPDAETSASGDMKTFISALMPGQEVTVPGGPRGPIGTSITNMFAEAQKRAQMLPDMSLAAGSSSEWSPVSTSAFPPADIKEMVLRVLAARPGPNPSPQRMYALLRKNEFQLAGCFSRDALFY